MMFERNPIDSHSAVLIAVEIEVDDGTVLHGRAALERGRSVHTLLKGGDDFVYIETHDGDASFVPKDSIKRLKIVKPVIPRPLVTPAHASDEALNPAAVLGVEADASWEAIRDAYRGLAKLYHPDRYAGVELPDEVSDYIETKAKQINQAFRLLKTARSGS
ncbi:MAG: J domain-containing protein [Pseudomonadota bacterium]